MAHGDDVDVDNNKASTPLTPSRTILYGSSSQQEATKVVMRKKDEIVVEGEEEIHKLLTVITKNSPRKEKVIHPTCWEFTVTSLREEYQQKMTFLCNLPTYIKGLPAAIRNRPSMFEIAVNRDDNINYDEIFDTVTKEKEELPFYRHAWNATKTIASNAGQLAAVNAVSFGPALSSWDSCSGAVKHLYPNASDAVRRYVAANGLLVNLTLYDVNIFNFFTVNRWRLFDPKHSSIFTRIMAGFGIALCGIPASASPAVINLSESLDAARKANNGLPFTFWQNFRIFGIDFLATLIVNGPLHVGYFIVLLQAMLLSREDARAARLLEIAASKFAEDPIKTLEYLSNALERLMHLAPTNDKHKKFRIHLDKKRTLAAMSPKQDSIPRFFGCQYNPALIKLEGEVEDYLSRLKHSEQREILLLTMYEAGVKPEAWYTSYLYYSGCVSFALLSLFAIFGNWGALHKFINLPFKDKVPYTETDTVLTNVLTFLPFCGKQSIYALSFIIAFKLLYDFCHRARGPLYIWQLPPALKLGVALTAIAALETLPSGIAFGDVSTKYLENVAHDASDNVIDTVLYSAWAAAALVNTIPFMRVVWTYLVLTFITLANAFGYKPHVPGNSGASKVIENFAASLRNGAAAPGEGKAINEYGTVKFCSDRNLSVGLAAELNKETRTRNLSTYVIKRESRNSTAKTEQKALLTDENTENIQRLPTNSSGIGSQNLWAEQNGLTKEEKAELYKDFNATDDQESEKKNNNSADGGELVEIQPRFSLSSCSIM